MMNYALVSTGANVDMGVDKKQACSSSSCCSNPLNEDDLTAIFTRYAERSAPNPRLAVEEAERRKLLWQVVAQQATLDTPTETATAAAVPPFQQQQEHTTTRSGRGGRFFGFLFRKRAKGNTQQQQQQDDAEQDLLLSRFMDQEDQWLEYYNDTGNDKEDAETSFSSCFPVLWSNDASSSSSSAAAGANVLDVHCIPRQAYLAARFALLSSSRAAGAASAIGNCKYDKQRSGGVPNVVRLCSSQVNPRGNDDDDGGPIANATHLGVVLTIVGLGVLCEMQKDGTSAAVVETSDFEDLHEHWTAAQESDKDGCNSHNNDDDEQQQQHSCLYNVNRARAALLNSSCTRSSSGNDGQQQQQQQPPPLVVAISWGLPKDGGMVILYQKDKQEQQGQRWMPIAFISPTRAVMDNVLLQQQQQGLHGNDDDDDDSISLLVTDLVVMTVKNPCNDPGSNKNNNDHGDAVTTALAISRLGGYIEFFIVPPAQVFAHRPRSTGTFKRRRTMTNAPAAGRNKKRRRFTTTTTQQHYANNGLYDVTTNNSSNKSSGGQAVALTTADFHVDVVCLEALRTNVGSETEWDNHAFPKTPPAEYVLAASGACGGGGGGGDNGKNGPPQRGQVVSFWSVSIVFDQGTMGNKAATGPNASIHVTHLSSINIGSAGPDVTVFASEAMWNKWRRPRNVRLRARPPKNDQMETDGDEMNEKDDNRNGDNVMVSSSSALAVDEHPKSKTSVPLCTLSTAMPIVRMRFASSDSQLKVFLAALDGNGGVAFIDCTIVIALATHEITHDSLDGASLLKMSCKLPPDILSPTTDIGWLCGLKDKREDDFSFALVVAKSRMLQVVSLQLSPRLDGRDKVARVSSSVHVPSMLRGATFIGSVPSQCISFVAFKTVANRRRLCQGNLERLDSTTVLAMLVKAAKYAEALDAAKTMNVPNCSETIQLCHKKLWERNGEIDHLSAVTDNDYVVKETLALFDDSDSRTVVDLTTARAACLLALDRKSRNASLSPGEQEEGFRDLESIEAKVSTYILLCMHGDAVPQLRQFREKFLSISLRQLASAFALNGDIVALTTILFRHRPELLPYQLEILDELPLETLPERYPHLLPVARAEKSFFHTGEHGGDGLREWSLMAHYMESTYGVRLLLDDMDEAVILDRCRLFDEREVVLQVDAVRKWFLSRAKRIQSEIGVVYLLRAFLELAFQRLGVSLASMQKEDVDPVLHELCSMNSYAVQLGRILTDGAGAATTGKLDADALATKSLSEIEKMTLEERVVFILGPPNDPSAVLSKLKNGFVFLAMDDEGARDQHQQRIDNSISAYCANAISSSVSNAERRSGHDDARQAMALRNALDVCTEIVNASRTSIQRSHRVVKGKAILMNLVVGTACNTSRASKSIDIVPSDCRHMVESLWESYECLPTRFSPDQASQSALQTKVDGLYRNLVIVDVFSRWSPAALRCLVDLNATESERANVGLTVLNEMCRSFCHQLMRFKAAAAIDLELQLLADLTSDINQVNNIGFHGTLQMASILHESLIKPLLQLEKFHHIGPLASWTNRDKVQAAVRAFVEGAMFDNDESVMSVDSAVRDDKVQAAIKCQDALGPLFPELHADFESSRRYLDAAFFINQMMAGSNEFTYPSQVRDKLPLDIIESVMTKNPGCILDGCIEWTDRTFSKKANEAICDHYRSVSQGNAADSSPTSGAALPVLPGSSIFHLSSLLGLEGPRALLVLKARVVYHSILASEFAAAAAVCATMVNENGASWDDPAVAHCIVDAVARVVSLNDYDDAHMKLVLCRAVLERDRGKLSVLDYQAYETVLDAFVDLKNMTRRHLRPRDAAVGSPEKKVTSEQEREYETPVTPDFLVFRAAGLVAKTAKNVARHAHQPHNPQLPGGFELPGIAFHRLPSLSERVYQDILMQYSTDIPHLFWILRGVAASSSMDDPLLLTLGRLLGFWCISDALRIRRQTMPLEPERADLVDVLALGMSLLLHTQDRERLASCVGELQGVLGREAAASMERVAISAQPDNVLPDPEIVQTLISRGYSENAARRAAVMTGNESAQVALVWAVSHTLDEGFDDPIVVVASPDGLPPSGRVDQSMIRCLQNALNSANTYISRKQTLQSLLPSRGSPSMSLERNPTPSRGALQQNGNSEKNASLGSETIRRPEPKSSLHTPADSHSTLGRTKVPRSIAPAGSLSASKLVAPKKQTKIPQSKKVIASATNPDGRVATSSSVASHKEAAKHKLAPPSWKPSRSKPISGTARATTKSTVPPTAPPPSAKTAREQRPPQHLVSAPKEVSTPQQNGDRSSTSKPHDSRRTESTTSNLPSDERRRLIEEGRRMLQQARASRRSSPSKIVPPKAGILPNDTAPSDRTDNADRYPLPSTRLSSAAVGTEKNQHATEGSNVVPPPAAATAAIAPKHGPSAEPSSLSESAAKQQDASDNDDGWDFDDF